MKDHQVTAVSAEPRIFLVSPILHCVSMTVLVYLRSSFGYGYLRPKSVFFAFSWAFGLFVVYAWIDGTAWREYRAVLWFGIGATALYWFHLVIVLLHEWSEKAAHDHYSGVSHLERIFVLNKSSDLVSGSRKLRLWGEPLVTVAVALFIRVVFEEHHLSRWLVLTAFCLWTKELLNCWFRIRYRKRRTDILEDVEDALRDQSLAPSPKRQTLAPSARKEKVKRTRALSAPTKREPNT